MSQNGQMLEDFKSVSDHFGTLCIKGMKLKKIHFQTYSFLKKA